MAEDHLTSTPRMPVAEQVCATLHRWPTREEWHEVGLLFFWFGMILLCDVLAVQAAQITSVPAYWLWNSALPTPSSSEQFTLWTAWGLQAFARAGFFTIFAYSLWRASTLGWGVLIARILQLKLIHTVLVVLAGLSIGNMLDLSTWNHESLPHYLSPVPPFFTAPVICGLVLLCAAPITYFKQGKFWALGVALFALFLYPGGPVTSREYGLHVPLVRGALLELSDGTLLQERHFKPESERYKSLTVVDRHAPPAASILQRYVAQHPNMSAWPINYQRNSRVIREERMVNKVPWHVKSDSESPVSEYAKRSDLVIETEALSPSRLQGPISAPGAGLGWLAVPIPFLGAIGLLLLWGLMGRRGIVDIILYGLLAGAAMIATVTPFMVGQPENNMFNFDPLGLVWTPFPGFEALMIVPWQELVSEYLAATLVLGLLLSAAVPWLLTALFLKPAKDKAPPDLHEPDPAQHSSHAL
jgi:hypothetical protein